MTQSGNANETEYLEIVRRAFAASISVKQQLLDQGDALTILADMSERIASAIESGGKLLLCGNGGSAADAQHLAAEMLVRLRPHVDRAAWPALSLATDTSTLTACGNDYGFDQVFERAFNGLHRPDDVLLAITTSGRSTNVIRVLEAARAVKVATLGFLGCGGGAAAALCDLAFIVPSDDTARVQESHINAGHALLEAVEERLMRGADCDHTKVGEK